MYYELRSRLLVLVAMRTNMIINIEKIVAGVGKIQFFLEIQIHRF